MRKSEDELKAERIKALSREDKKELQALFIQLKKIEGLLQEIGYTIRYERGNFQSGYAIVENRKIAVINKFFDTEARINSLLDILTGIEVNESMLDEKSLDYYKLLTTKVIAERETRAIRTTRPPRHLAARCSGTSVARVWRRHCLRRSPFG